MTLLIALQGFENFAMRGAEMQLQQQQQQQQQHQQHMKQQQSSSGGGVPQLAVGRSPVPAGPAAGLLTSSPSWPAWLSLRSCDWQGKGARGLRRPCLESLSETVTSSPSWPSLHWRISLVLKCWLNSLHAHMTFIAFNLQL